MSYKVIIAALWMMLLTLPVRASDWPHWRGPDYDGISRETDWNPSALNQPKILWQAEIGTGFSAVSVAKGKAYTLGNINKNTDVVYCFDAADGKQLWTFEYPEPLTPNAYEGGCNATPTIEDGCVYVLSKTGKAFCLDAKTGSEKWKRTLPYEKPGWGFSGSPVIIGEMVIYNAGSSGIALKKSDGSVVWKSEDAKAGYASPVPFQRDGKTCLAMFCGKDLKIVEAATGRVIMSYPWETSWDVNAADPIVSGDEIFITSGYGHGAALLKMTGTDLQLLWQNKSMRSQMSGPVLIDGYLYGIDDNKLACVQWSTGQQMWTEKAPKKGAVSAAGKKVLVQGEKGDLSIMTASPEGYQPLASAQVFSGRCWTMPILSNGCIYARNTVRKGGDKVICIDLRNPAPTDSQATIKTGGQ